VKLTDLEAKFRSDTGDLVAPFLFKAKDVHLWLNWAQDEACKRSDLIREDRDPKMTRLPVKAGGFPPDLDPAWTRIDSAVYVVGDERTNLRILTDRKVLDQESSDWRYEQGDPRSLLIEQRKLRLVRSPQSAGTLYLEGFRLPCDVIKPDGEPEIQSVHHLELVNWAIKIAYERPDVETRDPGRAQAAADAFRAYFGPARDVMQFQDTEVLHVVRASPL
jgi:hypothetical protein